MNGEKTPHTRAVRPLRIGEHLLPQRVSEAIWGFFAVYLVVFALLTLLMMAAGLDQVSAFSAVATCMNNLGPGLGDAAVTFVSLSAAAKLIAVLAMLLGRLEIFTMRVILAPAFWHH